ncbi:MAG: hypothetical protein V8R40_01555 [Dysosmobacter sp.]
MDITCLSVHVFFCRHAEIVPAEDSGAVFRLRPVRCFGTPPANARHTTTRLAVTEKQARSIARLPECFLIRL